MCEREITYMIEDGRKTGRRREREKEREEE